MIDKAIEIARNGERFLVACHRRPDADSLGSALGLIKTLRAIGKEATLFIASGSPLDIRTQVLRAFVAGREILLDDRHKRLWRKYQARPWPQDSRQPTVDSQ